MFKKDIKTCHLTSVHPIDDVRIFVKECSSLAANGMDVTLIACGSTAFEKIINGVKQISLYVPVSNRLQRMIKRTDAVYRKALEIDADIYHLHDPELLPVGVKLKRKGKKVIYDSHEDTSVLIRSRTWIPRVLREIISYFYSLYEKSVVKRLDAIISVTPLIVEKFKKINPNTYLVTNFPEVSHLDLETNIERQNICFAGGITHAYMFENVLNALDDTKGAKLILAGKVVSTQYQEELKGLKGWMKVDYVGKVSHNEVHELYKKSLIGIACLGYTENVGFKEGTLGVLKLFEFMNAGMAVICTDFRLWKEIIEKYNCGVCVNPYDVNEIKNAIQYLVDNPTIAAEMGKNGRKAVEQEYNWKTQEEKLVNLYHDL